MGAELKIQRSSAEVALSVEADPWAGAELKLPRRKVGVEGAELEWKPQMGITNLVVVEVPGVQEVL